LTRDYDSRKLIGALVVSVLLHAFMLYGDRIHFGSFEPVKRIVIHASLQTTMPSVPVPPPPAPAPAPAVQPKSAAPTPGTKPAPAPGAKPAPVPAAKPAATPAPGTKPAPAPEPEPPREAEVPPRAPLVMADPGAPEYPDEAVKRKLESCVLAAVMVSAAGEVEAVRILHADVAGVFDRSVIEAYSRARYVPAQAAGRNVPSRVLAVASFVLTPERARPCAGRYAPAARRINALPLSTEIDRALMDSLLNAPR
jgi:protein TonB